MPNDMTRQPPYGKGAYAMNSDAVAAFTDAARARGLILPNGPIADGKLHRCRVEGARPAKRDGAYVLHLDEHPAGWI